MSVVVQKVCVSISRKNGLSIIRLCHRDGKVKNFQPNENVHQPTKYSESKTLPLPLNFRDLPSSERSGFSKERTRDILGTYLAASSYVKEKDSNRDESDSRVEKYTCSGSVDLSSSMQSNVPQPFKANVRFTHLNMPRGQWRQEAKYISEQMNTFHYVNTRYSGTFSLVQSKCFFSSEKKSSEGEEIVSGQEQTKSQKLKAAIKEYGKTILVLHISLSLVSLGICYFLIQSGINLEEILKEQGWTDGAGVVSSAGPFIVAYAVHKVLAPFRVGLTLTLTPFVVHFLRKRGFKVKGK